MYQMTLMYYKITLKDTILQFTFSIRNIPNLGFLVWKYTIGNPGRIMKFQIQLLYIYVHTRKTRLCQKSEAQRFR
jgi:hypothetical protein